MKKTLAWLLAAALLCVALAGCAEKEEPAPVEETASGSLLSFDGQTLQLDGDASFDVSGDTAVELARGFMYGDSFTVRYQPESGAVLSVSSQRAEDAEFVLRGTVKSIGTETVTIAGDDGETYSFPLSTAALDLWQGLEKGIYVEAAGLGVPGEEAACLWLQSLRDNDGKALLSPEAEEEEPAEETEEDAEGPVEEVIEPAMDGEETETLAWELETVEDEVWVSAAANLRAGPGMEYTRMAQVSGGETLTRLGIAGDWSLVKWNGTEGYVSNALLLTAVPEKSYVIHYEAAGGESAPEDQYKAQGVDIALSNASPVRAGYTFEGWNTHEEGYGMRHEPGELFQMDEDTVLYAQWSEGEAEPEPTPEPETEEEGEEEAEEPAEPEAAPEPGPIVDSCRPLRGVIEEMDAKELVLDVEGELYSFDISMAAIQAERGLHPGDSVTVWYAGEIGPEKDCSRAPAVCLEVTAGKARLAGEVAGLWANGLALEVEGELLFLEADSEGLAVGDKVTATLKAAPAESNLLAADKIE